MLTVKRAREDYVKAIYQLGAGEPVAAAHLARYLGVSRAAVTKFRRVLVNDRLVEPASRRTDLIRLSARGRFLAVGMLRRHRLVETFLHEALGMPLDKLHAQAEAIEHVISDEVARRLQRFLGNPRVDPHGHAIRRLTTPRARNGSGSSLADAPAGSSVRVMDIPDRDPSVVRRLVAQRVLPGLTARIVGRRGDSIVLRSDSGRHSVGAGIAASIRVRAEKRRGRH